MFNNFKTSQFQFKLKSLSPISLPVYKGSAFRGGFGTVFKKIVCTIKRKECVECLLYNKCIYVYIFETTPKENSEILRNYSKVPHPFIIEPPLETKREYQGGEELNFNLILIGRAIEYLPYFIYAFSELGNTGIGKGRGEYELRAVSFEGEEIYNSIDKKLKIISQNDSSSLILPSGSKLITLNFLTPVRLKFNEDLMLDIEFHHLIRALLRRISALSYFHCEERLDIDFKGLIDKAKEVKCKERKLYWYDWERYSARQDTRMKMGGLVGKISFEGDLSEFMPFIKLGEMLHVGKGTSFGLGKYEVLFPS